jgi:hypothetical protein
MERSGDLITRARRQRHHSSCGRQSFDQWLLFENEPNRLRGLYQIERSGDLIMRLGLGVNAVAEAKSSSIDDFAKRSHAIVVTAWIATD